MSRRRRRTNRVVPAEPSVSSHLRRWASLRWYLLLATPHVAAWIAAWFRWPSMFTPTLLVAMGCGFSLAFFDVLITVVSTSNWGTYRRDTQPVRYYMDVALLATAYVAIAAAGFCIPPET